MADNTGAAAKKGLKAPPVTRPEAAAKPAPTAVEVKPEPMEGVAATTGGAAVPYQKKKFAPKVPAARPVDAGPPPKPTASPRGNDRGRGDRGRGRGDRGRGRGDRGRGRGDAEPQKNTVSGPVGGVFANFKPEARRRSSGGGWGGGGGGGDGGEHVRSDFGGVRSGLKVETHVRDVDVEEDGEVLPEAHVDDINDYNPVTLPLIDLTLEEDEAQQKVKTEAQDTGAGVDAGAPADVDMGTHVLRFESGEPILDDKLLFLQLPAQLPIDPALLTGDTEETVAAGAAPDAYTPVAKRARIPDMANSLKVVPPGHVGTLRVRRSGRMEMVLGGTVFEIAPATRCTFLQQVVTVDGATKDCCLLGEVAGRMVVTPDIVKLLNNKDAAGSGVVAQPMTID